MKRRRFVLLSSAMGTVLALKGCSLFGTDNKQLMSRANSLGFIWNNDMLIKIGYQYQMQFPLENAEEALLNELKGDLSDEVVMARELKQKIYEDFKTDRTIMLDGWLISITEARQCALYSTLNS